ncbi:hypothetical protein MSG28_014420 [Choristoneura fumiferana]|uniref:Uncharacterized protein n=1 Tax=Choristoneura fumiferana TaxID=7141 RepID=A0ACC0JRP5_CHOFU|nr:hypothetical protein MSG28_014420 [Choristoneura fumiferana]
MRLTCVCMWSCSSARSTISTGDDSFTDLGLHDMKICTGNDSFTDHGLHNKHIKVEGFIWGVASKVACMLRHCLRVNCGTPTPIANRLIINGKRTKHGELPWHAGVYDKTFTPYKQICGGSLISTRVIISAAHCFWKTERQEAASTYAVALGKIYRPWDEARDTGAHKSDVSEIKIPVRYLGEAGHYQADIALVFMSTPVVYRTYIRPICMDFNEEFDRNQLQNTNSGKQKGFRKNVGINMAVYDFINIVMDSVDNGIPVCALFTDMTKAFDHVDHKILLYKLGLYGIRGQVRKLIESYLTDRQQYTEISRVSGWGLTAADGPASSLLLTTDLPYVDATKCMDELPSEFKPHLTSDKFCAGNKNGKYPPYIFIAIIMC